MVAAGWVEAVLASITLSEIISSGPARRGDRPRRYTQAQFSYGPHLGARPRQRRVHRERPTGQPGAASGWRNSPPDRRDHRAADELATELGLVNGRSATWNSHDASCRKPRLFTKALEAVNDAATRLSAARDRSRKPYHARR